MNLMSPILHCLMRSSNSARRSIRSSSKRPDNVPGFFNIWACGFLLLAASMLPYTSAAASLVCENPVHTPYNVSPAFFAPDGTRGEGVQIWNVGPPGVPSPIPDTRAACLPIPLRYNNLGALKTPSSGPWPGQIARDGKGHAIFASIGDGIAAWSLWMKKRVELGGPQTAMTIMSLYAPPDDCVGSVGTPPDCPYGINPTRTYANRVASAVGLGPDDVLPLSQNCSALLDTLYAILREIATFEIGGDFCGRKAANFAPSCEIDRALFDNAASRAFGPANQACQ